MVQNSTLNVCVRQEFVLVFLFRLPKKNVGHFEKDLYSYTREEGSTVRGTFTSQTPKKTKTNIKTPFKNYG